MDGPYIVDLESNSNGYDSGLDLFAQNSPKRKTYNGSNDSPVPKSSLAHDKQIDHIINRLHEPRPSSLRLITSFPSSSITSPCISDSDSSSCLSITPSMIPEDCPCKCGSFRGSCLALTLPPSPLHFWVRGTEGEPAQHLFINDVQQFETVQRIELQNTLQEVHVRLDRLRETKSPPRCIRPWSEPEIPPTTLDVPNGSASGSEAQSFASPSMSHTISNTKGSGLSRYGGLNQDCKHQHKTTVGARSRSNELDDKISLSNNPRHHYPLRSKPTKSPIKMTSTINAPEPPGLSKRASRTRMPPSLNKSKTKQRSTVTTKTVTKTATRPTPSTTRHLGPPSSPTTKMCRKSSRRLRHERSTSPKRQRGSDDDIVDEEEEPQPKKRQ